MAAKSIDTRSVERWRESGAEIVVMGRVKTKVVGRV